MEKDLHMLINLIWLSKYAKRSPWQIKHKVDILFKLIAEETSCAAKNMGKNFNNVLSGPLS